MAVPVDRSLRLPESEYFAGSQQKSRIGLAQASSASELVFSAPRQADSAQRQACPGSGQVFPASGRACSSSDKACRGPGQACPASARLASGSGQASRASGQPSSGSVQACSVAEQASSALANRRRLASGVRWPAPSFSRVPRCDHQSPSLGRGHLSTINLERKDPTVAQFPKRESEIARLAQTLCSSAATTWGRRASLSGESRLPPRINACLIDMPSRTCWPDCELPLGGQARHNKRLLLPDAFVLKELAVVRLRGTALWTSARCASARFARSRSAVR